MNFSLENSKNQLLLLLAGTIVFGLMLEGALRVARVRYDGSFYTADARLGWALRPAAQGWMSSEGEQFVHINNAGFHDREHSIAKPSGSIRIAVLGNSWTEALQVPLEANFCSVLERNLAGCAALRGRKVEVLTFGVSGYSTAQELLLLRERVWTYNPDVVLLALYTARDIVNNIRELNNAAAPEQSPYFIYSGGRLILDDSFRKLRQVQDASISLQNLRGRIADKCRLYETVTYITRHWKVQAARAALADRNMKSGVNLEDAIYLPSPAPPVENAWRVTEDLISTMNTEVRAHGAAFWLVTLANRTQVMFDPIRKNAALQKLGITDFDYPDRRIQAFARQRGISCLVLAPALRAYAEREKVFLNGFPNTSMGEGHWNELGHRLAGQAIAAGLCASFQSGSKPAVPATHADDNVIVETTAN